MLKLYHLQHGRYPSAEYGLRSLIERTPDHRDDPRWTKLLDRVPLDPWNQEYRYVVSPDLDEGFGLYSVGADGVSASMGNDPDDSHSWGVMPVKEPEGMGPPGIFLLAIAAAAAGFLLGRRGCAGKVWEPGATVNPASEKGPSWE